MGVLKQLMIDKQDELGEDWEGSSDDLIERMEGTLDMLVDEYMRSEEYHKEHIDQEKLRLTT